MCPPVQGADPEQAEDCAGSRLVGVPAQPERGAGLSGNSCPDQGETCSCGTPLALGWPLLCRCGLHPQPPCLPILPAWFTCCDAQQRVPQTSCSVQPHGDSAPWQATANSAVVQYSIYQPPCEALSSKELVSRVPAYMRRRRLTGLRGLASIFRTVVLDWQQDMLADVGLVPELPAGPEHVQLQLMPRRLSSAILTPGQNTAVLHPHPCTQEDIISAAWPTRQHPGHTVQGTTKLHPPAPAFRTSELPRPAATPTSQPARHCLPATSRPCLQDTKAARETQALQDFYSMLGQDSARAFYGPGHVRAAHELGAIQTLLITDSLFRVNDVARVSAAPGLCPAGWYSGAGRALALTVQKRGWTACCTQRDSIL